MLKFEEAKDVRRIAEDIIKKLGMDWIDLERVHFVRSYGSKGRSIARCYGLSRIWQFALREKPHYIIEVISERFDKLSEKEKVKVIIHELLHIPKKFSGGLRDHRYVNEEKIRRLYKEYVERSKK